MYATHTQGIIDIGHWRAGGCGAPSLPIVQVAQKYRANFVHSDERLDS